MDRFCESLNYFCVDSRDSRGELTVNFNSSRAGVHTGLTDKYPVSPVSGILYQQVFGTSWHTIRVLIKYIIISGEGSFYSFIVADLYKL